MQNHYDSTQYDTDEWSPQGPVTELTEAHAWTLLASESFGRLALSLDDRPQIFPVNYVVDGASILFRTAEGAKLTELISNSHVAFEADANGSSEAWSVVARGVAAVVTSDKEVARADALPLPSWIPTRSFVYVRVVPSDIRGRHFDRRFHAER